MNWKARIKTDPEHTRRSNGVVALIVVSAGVTLCVLGGVVLWVLVR